MKQRRLQYGWVQGPGLAGEDDSTLAGTSLSLKNNFQSLLREVTYDPRLGMLNFAPIEELKLLRKSVLASVRPQRMGPAAWQIPLGGPQTHGGVANQSEIRVFFDMPTAAVTLGVRVMCDSMATGPRRDGVTCLELGVEFEPAPAGKKAWGVNITRTGGSFQYETLPLLATDKTLEITIFVDQNVVEAFFMGGRIALTQHVPPGLLRPKNAAGGGNEEQSVELYSLGGGEVTLSNATMWAVADIWDPATHGRPHAKP